MRTGAPGRGTELLVVHVGDSPASSAGGISRVIRNHLARQFDAISVASLTSYDPTASGQLSRQAPALRSVVRLVRWGRVRSRPAILHVHMSNRLSLLREGTFALLGRLLGWKVCVTWHSSSGLTRMRGTARLALRLALAPGHLVHVLSDVHAATVPAARARVVVVPNDVPAPAAVAPMEERDCAVVFAGELGHRKGADILLSAWRELGPPVKAGWRLEMFGRISPEMASTVSGIADDSVSVPGLTPADEVQRALLRSSIAVLPSRAEALPMFVLEAMAAGCAVVATEVGAIPSVLDQDAGMLVPAEDPQALANALGRLMTSLELRAGLAAAARERALGDFGEDRMTARWQALYTRLVHQGANGAPSEAREPREKSDDQRK